MTEYVEIFLSCASWQEAQKIADDLLNDHLVACVEFMVSESKYHYNGAIEAAHEVKLAMQTRADLFDSIEQRVGKLHSYETPNLHAVPIAIISEPARSWLKSSVADN